MLTSQVVANFISNAIKYSPAGSRVEVSSTLEPCNERPPLEPRASSRQGFNFRVEVRDYGIGIDPKEQSKLFQAFQQVRVPN